MKIKYSFNEAFPFGWSGIKGWAYNSKGDFSGASAAVFEVDGAHGKVQTSLSDRIYYVIEGRGEFFVGKEVVPVRSTDVVIIPRDTEYDYKGEIKLFLVHTPAYDDEYEIRF
ncbi:hypothetical protein C4577_06945 [Candidatus Parcubacteria bacterium]|nr:MAG: hypothetical protein C4577_06945 [Candidatus Parcubacteria bacterium]